MNNVYSYISRYLNEYKPEVKEAEEYAEAYEVCEAKSCEESFFDFDRESIEGMIWNFSRGNIKFDEEQKDFVREKFMNLINDALETIENKITPVKVWKFPTLMDLRKIFFSRNVSEFYSEPGMVRDSNETKDYVLGYEFDREGLKYLFPEIDEESYKSFISFIERTASDYYSFDTEFPDKELNKRIWFYLVKCLCNSYDFLIRKNYSPEEVSVLFKKNFGVDVKVFLPEDQNGDLPYYNLMKKERKNFFDKIESEFYSEEENFLKDDSKEP